MLLSTVKNVFCQNQTNKQLIQPCIIDMGDATCASVGTTFLNSIWLKRRRMTLVL